MSRVEGFANEHREAQVLGPGFTVQDLAIRLIDSGLVGSTEIHPGRGATRAEAVQGTSTQSHIPSRILPTESHI